jgi:hypothetical protein
MGVQKTKEKMTVQTDTNIPHFSLLKQSYSHCEGFTADLQQPSVMTECRDGSILE